MDQRAEIGREHERHAGTPALTVSLLRMSVPARLGIAAVMALLLWTAMYWALA